MQYRASKLSPGNAENREKADEGPGLPGNPRRAPGLRLHRPSFPGMASM